MPRGYDLLVNCVHIVGIADVDGDGSSGIAHSRRTALSISDDAPVLLNQDG
jgi:hypothetical protein